MVSPDGSPLQGSRRVPTAVSTRCVYAQCPGMLHTRGDEGYCTVCRLPIRTCPACQSFNRSQARFCRECGEALAVEAQPQTQPSLDPKILERSPARSEVDQPIPTSPQAAGGFLWAVGEEGSLFRINPFGLSGRQIEVQTRLWAGKQRHAFAVRELRLPEGATTGENFAVVATRSGVEAWGLVSKSLLRFQSLRPGEQILCDARDAYQLVEASGSDAFCLVRSGAQTSLLRVHLPSGESDRLSLDASGEAICGPVLVGENTLVAWSAKSVITVALSDGTVQREAAPAGVRLWTGPSDDGKLRLPLGRSPAILSPGRFFLPCHQYGEPALLHFQASGVRWLPSVLPITSSGVLSEDAEGNPLLASRGHLAVYLGNGVRELAGDDQLSGQFAGFHSGALSIFFCEDSYGGRNLQWLKARGGSEDLRVEWGLAPDQRLKECGGFWAVAGSITTQMLLEDRFARTEFVSWHD